MMVKPFAGVIAPLYFGGSIPESGLRSSLGGEAFFPSCLAGGTEGGGGIRAESAVLSSLGAMAMLLLAGGFVS